MLNRQRASKSIDTGESGRGGGNDNDSDDDEDGSDDDDDLMDDELEEVGLCIFLCLYYMCAFTRLHATTSSP